MIVLDDRPEEKDEIQRFLVEDCGCRPHFYRDFREAFTALLEQVGDRLLVNYQLGNKQLGAYLLEKLRTTTPRMEVPTVVINCRPDQSADVHRYCGSLDFVAEIVEASELHFYVQQIKRAFARPVTAKGRPPVDPPGARPKVFVIHGHDLSAIEENRETALNRMVRLLEVRLSMDAVVIRSEPVATDTLIQKIDRDVKSASFAIALFTADDVGRLRTKPKGLPRARQNVLFETGFARGHLGPERVIIFKESGVEMPSDLGGILTLSLEGTDDEIVIALMQKFSDLGIDSKLRRA